MHIFKDWNKISGENTLFNFISYVIAVDDEKRERQNLLFEKFKKLIRNCETESP